MDTDNVVSKMHRRNDDLTCFLYIKAAQKEIRTSTFDGIVENNKNIFTKDISANIEM